MPTSDDVAALETVSRRASVLHALGRTPVRTHALVDRLDHSRSTVDRALDELAGLGLVTREDGGHRLTTAGELVTAEQNRYVDRLETLSTVADPLAALPHDAEIPSHVLDGADVVTPEPHSPQLPVRPLCDLLDESTSVRSFAPAVAPEQVACYRRNVVDGDCSADLVVTEPVLERLAADFRGDLLAGLETGRLDVRRVAAGEGLPFGLAVCERPDGPALGLVVYADVGVRGFVGTDDPAAVEWARSRLEDCWAAATPVHRLDGTE
jgi:predicted transcriptional regulator